MHVYTNGIPSPVHTEHRTLCVRVTFITILHYIIYYNNYPQAHAQCPQTFKRTYFTHTPWHSV